MKALQSKKCRQHTKKYCRIWFTSLLCASKYHLTCEKLLNWSFLFSNENFFPNFCVFNLKKKSKIEENYKFERVCVCVCVCICYLSEYNFAKHNRLPEHFGMCINYFSYNICIRKISCMCLLITLYTWTKAHSQLFCSLA